MIIGVVEFLELSPRQNYFKLLSLRGNMRGWPNPVRRAVAARKIVGSKIRLIGIDFVDGTYGSVGSPTPRSIYLGENGSENI